MLLTELSPKGVNTTYCTRVMCTSTLKQAGHTATTGLPSADAIRSFRARHPELRYRKSESKETVKLKGENFDHVSTYATVLKHVQSDFPGIFEHGDFVWNMDETHVDGEFGERQSVYSPVSHHLRVCLLLIATNKHGGDGRHVTVVLAVSASGKKAPPFFIVEGKRNMSNWYLKLEKEEYDLSSGHLRVLTEDGWFPSDACVVMADKGSMEMRIIPLFMQHLNNFVRKFVPEKQPYVLVLDGHSSRKGIEWLELAQEMKCVVVQSPANTSHFLQPCDQQVNKTFQTTVRSTRDAFCGASNSTVDIRNIKVKLMLGVIACEAISPEDIRISWFNTGLWPMDFTFPERWRTRLDEMKNETVRIQHAFGKAGPASALAAVRGRRSDKETFETLATILDAALSNEYSGVSRALQAVARCLQKHETVQGILASRWRGSSRTTTTKVSAHNAEPIVKPKNVALPAGAPAEYLSHGDVVRRRKEEQAKKEAEAAAKAEARRVQVQKATTERRRQEKEGDYKSGIAS